MRWIVAAASLLVGFAVTAPATAALVNFAIGGKVLTTAAFDTPTSFAAGQSASLSASFDDAAPDFSIVPGIAAYDLSVPTSSFTIVVGPESWTEADLLPFINTDPLAFILFDGDRFFGLVLAAFNQNQITFVSANLYGAPLADDLLARAFLVGGEGPEAFGIFGVVPEPATWALMIGGFGLIGVAMRRRRPAIA